MNNSADIEGHLGHGTAVTGIIKQHVPRADIFCINLFENDYMVDFEVVFRFENFMDYESINGLERYFIPIYLMKKYYAQLHNVINLLKEGYVVSMPVNKGSINFYESEGIRNFKINCV